MNKAVLLDRDGVINELVYHQEQEVIDAPFTVRQFKLMKGISEFINTIHQYGFKVIVISNQPGIAKGHMSASTFNKIRIKMKNELAKSGIILDGEYYCLHHPEAKIKEYRIVCECRKPKPGLLLQAAKEFNIDLKRSWMVGDNLSDIQAGKNANCHTILLGQNKCETCINIEERKIYPDYVVTALKNAIDIIINNPPREYKY